MARPEKERKSAGRFAPPRTISRSDYLRSGGDERFREAIYTLVQGFGRLAACREAFGRTLGLTASQFVVLMGTGYRQKDRGVSIGDLARHVSLAPTQVTTDVGRLIRKGYLLKRPSPLDGRSVLVSLAPRGEGRSRRSVPSCGRRTIFSSPVSRPRSSRPRPASCAAWWRTRKARCGASLPNRQPVQVGRQGDGNLRRLGGGNAREVK